MRSDGSHQGDIQPPKPVAALWCEEEEPEARRVTSRATVCLGSSPRYSMFQLLEKDILRHCYMFSSNTCQSFFAGAFGSA